MDSYCVELKDGRKIYCKQAGIMALVAYYKVDCYYKNGKRVPPLPKPKKQKPMPEPIAADPPPVVVVPVPPPPISKPAKRANKSYSQRYRPQDAIPGWDKIRKEILRLDDYVCRICFEPDDLTVHHIDYDRRHNDSDNLVTLCAVCHRGVHQEGYKPELYIDWPIPWKLNR